MGQQNQEATRLESAAYGNAGSPTLHARSAPYQTELLNGLGKRQRTSDDTEYAASQKKRRVGKGKSTVRNKMREDSDSDYNPSS